MNKEIGAYQTVDTVGKDQIGLILKVYDGALAALTSARTNYEKQQYSKGYGHLERAEKMVTHLYTTLDPEKGGEIAVNLGKLYAWIITKLHEVQITKELARFDECIKVLTNLRAGWAEIKESSIPKATVEGTLPETRQFEEVG